MSRLYILVVIICFSLNVHTQSAEDFNKRGLRNYQHGDYDAAIADFSKAIDAATRLAKQNSVPAKGFAPGQELFEAAATSVRAVDPRASDVLVNRGNAFLAKGDLGRAIEDYNGALAIRPTFAVAYVCRGSAWLIKNNLPRAVSDYEKAIKLAPRFAKAYIGRGMARLDAGDTRAAFEDFDLAVRLEPKNANAVYQRGDARR
ncbi:MAG TPA: tetratricopeptide repeat protein, partial [Pyrinomonadaceae bacterium]|nr:tetratricopeptide repeat protein [Pyrinomonadaceae bacterium]